jgi:hypothetical protein
MDEIKVGDLVTYIINSPEDARQLFMVIKVNHLHGTYTVMRYSSIEDFTHWHNRDIKIQDVWKPGVRKELFQTQLMQAELHNWFTKGVVSAK